MFSAEFHSFDVEAQRRLLTEQEMPILEEYVAYVVDNELGWLCSEAELLLFPILDTNWEFPAHISNCIIDVSEQVWCIDPLLLKQLEALCCNFIQVRFYKSVTLSELQGVLDVLSPTQIKAIEISFPYNEMIDFDRYILDLINQNRKVRNITVFGAPKNAIIKREDIETGSVFMTKRNANNQLHCGIVEFEQFSINIPHYTESLKYNTCLNRKISIDGQGNIKNCPSMPDSFGNISDTTLAEAINKPGFKKYWEINKDQIAVCRDCELRHICTDCRAYLENPEDLYSKPLKCGYDPYTNQREDWSTHPLKQHGITWYGLDKTLSKF